jgi:hypothetical protein
MSILALAIKGLKTMYSNKIKKPKRTTVNHNTSGFSEVSSQLLFRQNQFSV